MPLDKKFKDVLSLNFGKDDEIHVGLLASSGQFNNGTITLGEIDEFITEYKDDYNVFMCYAPIEGDDRLLENAKPTRFLVADIDGAEIPKEFPPSYYWETSPNKYQGLWISDKVIAPKDYEVLAHAMVKKFKFDSASDIVHLYRIPTTVNHKYATPQEVSEPKGDGVVYRRQDIFEILEYDKYKKGTKKKKVKSKRIPNKDYDLEELYKKYEVKPLVEREITDRSAYVYAIAKALYEQGAKSSEVKYVVMSTDQDKWDRDEIDKVLLRIKSKTKRRKKVSSSVNISEDEVHIIGINDVKEGEHGEEWLIEGLWEYDSVGLIVAPPKSYKSTLITNMAVAVASGKPFDGRKVIQGGVLILQGENSLVAEKSRMMNIAGTTDLPIYYVQSSINLDNIEVLKRTIIENSIKMLVVDPLYLLFGSGNMNHQVDVTPKLRNLTELRKETGCSIILVHHTRKTDGSSDLSTSDINGSGFFEGWYESLIMLQPPRRTVVRKVKMFNRFRNHMGSEGTIRIDDSLKMTLNLDDDFGGEYSEDKPDKPINTRKERLKKKKAKKSKKKETVAEEVNEEEPKPKKSKALRSSRKRSKRVKQPTYTTTLETFYKPSEGELERFESGMTIDLSKTKKIYVDIETTGLNNITDKIKTIQITDESENTYVLWVDGNYSELKAIAKFLNQFKIITHGGKFDSLFFFKKCGVALKLFGDTQILAHMLTEPSLKLKDLIEKYLGITYDIDKEIKKSNKKVTVASVKKELKEWALENTELKKLTPYNKMIEALYNDLEGSLFLDKPQMLIKFVDEGTDYDKVLDYYSKVSERVLEERRMTLIKYGMGDTIYGFRLYNCLYPKVKAYKLLKVYRHEVRAYNAYIEVEKEGVTIDFGLLGETRATIEKELKQVEKELYSFDIVKEAEVDNFNSAQQKVRLFCEVLGWETKHMTKGGQPQVNQSQLEEWSKEGKHEILDVLLRYNKLTKQLQFVDKWEELSQYDGKLHPSFNITADTGRTTCKNPNIQQVPQESTLRNVITCPKGRKFIEVDMSQAELRVASIFSEDANMIHAYQSGSDLHQKTMELIKGGKKPKNDQEAKRWRTEAKSCFTGDTEILTEKGFIPFNMYDGKTPVAQYNIESQKISYTEPLDFRRITNQKVCTFENENTSLRLTPNHECIIQVQNTRKYMKKAPYEELAGHGQTKYAWVNAGFFDYDESKFINDNLTRFVSAFVADGSYNKSRTILRFGFTEERKITRFRNLLEDSKINYKETVQGKNKVTVFTINDFDTVNLVKRYCLVDKTLTLESLKELNPKVYLDEARYWDGHVNKHDLVRVSSTNKNTLDFMQIMAIQSGIRARIVKRNDAKGNISEHWCISYNMNKGCLSRFESKDIDTRTCHNTNCTVYCVTVPEHNIVIRHNNKVSIQGNCNFGLLYGMSAKTYQEYAKGYDMEITLEEAEDIREAFFESYPKLLDMHKKFVEYAKKYGYTYSPIGRKRFLPNLKSNNWKDVSEAERQAINTPVQGFASDLVISALADILEDESLDKSKYKIIGSVHDAILVEADEDVAEEYAKKVKEHMENPSILELCDIEITVPLVADIEIGSAWGKHD